MRLTIGTALLLPLLCLGLEAQDAPSGQFPKEFLEGWSWREVGPYRGGRVAAVCGVPGKDRLYYMGAAGGGVWKTEDAGVSWKNISDGFFGGSIGAVAVSEWDPNVIYVGGGEKTVRGNVSHGDGMWRSTDAGKTWKHIGLPDSRRISRIRIHPRNPDLVYAAVMGHLFGPNEERGVYRSKNGGESWERVHFVNADSGCVDLAMDPNNARILYASFWRLRRSPWGLSSGGEGSGIWKSTDSGDSWTEISRNRGLPKGTLGISGICVSPSDSENLYAIVEAEKGGVFRSRDGGDSWSRVNDDRNLRQRAWYYSRIYAVPGDADAVYVLNVGFHYSKDGGKTFSRIGTPHGDNHDLWIDPADPKRMVQSNDGGANVSFDAGATWSRQDNQPTSQMYRVSVDNAFPYRLLGGQQDNSALRIRSRSLQSGTIGTRDWEPTAGGESGHIVAKPDDPDVVLGGSYGGFLTMLDHRSGARRGINVWPDNPMGWGAAELRYRFQWNFPIFFSPHDPNRVYAAANVLFVSDDLGASWTAISPDLTRDDKKKQVSSGGPITKDNTSVEYYCTIFAAAESTHEAGVLWCGSDDGLLHLSRNAGKKWTQVTPPGMPEWAQINSIDVHPSEPGGLYVAATRYRLDDFEPLLFRTLDYGKTWKRIDAGIPREHFTRVVRADPGAPGLLYAGTERGVYYSRDDGASWHSMQLDLPVVPITDLAVKEGDLVAATQGRGYWILDDLSALHQVKDSLPERAFFAPSPSYRVSMRGGRGRGRAGSNPTPGIHFRYWLAEDLPKDESLTLEIFSGEERLIRFDRKGSIRAPLPKGVVADDSRRLEAKAGLNRYSWDGYLPSADRFEGMVVWNSSRRGPRILPGRYTALLTVGEEPMEVEFELLPDPRHAASRKDLEAQYQFVLEVRDRLSETHRGLAELRSLRSQLETLKGRAGKGEAAKPLREAIKALVEEFGEVEKTLYQTKSKSRQDPLNFPIRLNDKLAGLLSLAGRGDFAPTAQALELREEFDRAIVEQLQRYRKARDSGIAEINRLSEELALPAVELKSGPPE